MVALGERSLHCQKGGQILYANDSQVGEDILNVVRKVHQGANGNNVLYKVLGRAEGRALKAVGTICQYAS